MVLNVLNRSQEAIQSQLRCLNMASACLWAHLEDTGHYWANYSSAECCSCSVSSAESLEACGGAGAVAVPSCSSAARCAPRAAWCRASKPRTAIAAGRRDIPPETGRRERLLQGFKGSLKGFFKAF